MKLIGSTPKILSWAIGLELAEDFSKDKVSTAIIDFDYFSATNFRKHQISHKFSRTNGYKYININQMFSHREITEIYRKSFDSVRILGTKNLDDLEEIQKIMLDTIRSVYGPRLGTRNFQYELYNLRHILQICFELQLGYLGIKKLVAKDLTPDTYYICGARDAFGAGSLLAIRELGINYVITEAGSDENRWTKWTKSPHFAPDWWKYLQEIDIDAVNSNELSLWWQKTFNGIDGWNGINWSHTRVNKLIPANLPNEFITFFSTSDYEIPIFSDFEHIQSEFKSQSEAVRALNLICKFHGIKLVIRRHPASVNYNGLDLEKHIWQEFIQDTNVIYIPPSAKIDSVELAKLSSLVFVFESSIGVQSIKLGTPAFALGSAVWAYCEDLRAWSFHKLSRIISNQFIQNPKMIENWAALLIEFGYSFRLFTSANSREALYKFQKITTQEFKRKIFTRLLFFYLQIRSSLFRWHP